MQITRGQLYGATVIVFIITSLYFVRFFLHQFRPFHTTSIPYVEKRAGSVVVELAGNIDHKGIYFVPQKTTVSDLFRVAKIADIERFDKKILSTVLGSGEKVSIVSNQLKISEIDAVKRIVLEIPIDINNTTIHDLMLVPGIGEKTAKAIVDLRERTGGITSISDLLKIHGMGEKKLANIKKYFYVREAAQQT